MNRICFTYYNIRFRQKQRTERSCLEGRLFLYLPCPSYRESRNSRSRKDDNTAIDRPKNYRAKVANASVRTTRSGPLRGFPGKIILALLRYFSEKPCLSGSICSKGPCSSTGCQSPDIHNLNKRSMQQTIIARQSPAPAWIPVIEKKKKIRIPEPHIKLPGRGATGPVPVSTLLNPVLEICNHRDRNRLLAEFFREY